MTEQAVFRRFAEFAPLCAREAAAVEALTGAPQRFDRHRTIRGEGEPANCFYMLIEGWAAAAITLPDGARQILKVHLPGDAIGTPSMAVTTASETLLALTPVTVAPVTFERFGKLLDDHPRVGACLLLTCQRERIALMDRLASIGRTTAESRLAAFLLDMRERLEAIGAASENSFHLHLTQEQIGDVISLTSVHVNRTVRDIEAAGLIQRDGSLWILADLPALKRLAKRPVRALRTDLAWLPAPR